MIETAERVLQEVHRQYLLWGKQYHPNGTGPRFDVHLDFWRGENARMIEIKKLTWGVILLEEVFEALAETDPDNLKTELIQVMAVCASWLSAIDT